MLQLLKERLLEDIASAGDTGDALVVHLQLDSTWDDVYKFEQSLRTLPLKSQAKITSKKHIADQHTSLANQVLQHQICELIQPNSQFKFNEYGKPYVNDEFGFSMSNQQGHVAMVVQFNAEVGIDLASVDDLVEGWEELYRGVMNEIEVDQVNGDKSQFTKLWSLKEAYTKYLGIGLNCDLREFAFEIGHGEDWFESRLFINKLEKSLKFYTKEVQFGLFLTVCLQTGSPLNLHTMTLEEILEA